MLGHVIGGKYVLERQIGGGAMGHIWEALDQQLRRRVALKLMAPELTASASMRSRFELEAKAIAKLRNHYVIQIYDYGHDEGCPYIVMELLEGEDLQRRLRKQQRISPACFLRILEQVAKGLGAAHASGIVHRDLKPANIFLSRTDGDEIAKIVDFGIVSVEADPLGRLTPISQRNAIGTPAYMSPEQVLASPLDPRSDLWSLAVVAYEALTGELPFSGLSLGALFREIFSAPLRLPTSIVPDLPKAIDAFFDRALAKAPAQRFQSAADMAAAFGALCAASAAGSVKILVVDDERDMALLIEQCFLEQIQRSAYEFIFAADGEEAIEALRLHPDVAVVLTDLNMPNMDGLTLLGRIAENRPKIKTIVVSAYDDMGNIRGAMNRGAFDFLVKPIDFDDLASTLDKATRHVAETRQSARLSEENSLLRTFVSSRLIERLGAPDPSGATRSRRVDGTVVVVSVCALAAMIRHRPPEDAAQELNASFDAIVPELIKAGGAVDKFLGDAVLTVFQGEEHLARALGACLAVHARLAALASRTDNGPPYTPGAAIGLSTGALLEVVVGSKVSGRLADTVLGDAVTTAGHLARAGAPGQTLVDAHVVAVVGDRLRFEALGSMVVPGTSEPILAYCPIFAAPCREGSSPELMETLPRAQESPSMIETAPSPPTLEQGRAR